MVSKPLLLSTKFRCSFVGSCWPGFAQITGGFSLPPFTDTWGDKQGHPWTFMYLFLNHSYVVLIPFVIQVMFWVRAGVAHPRFFGTCPVHLPFKASKHTVATPRFTCGRWVTFWISPVELLGKCSILALSDVRTISKAFLKNSRVHWQTLDKHEHVAVSTVKGGGGQHTPS